MNAPLIARPASGGTIQPLAPSLERTRVRIYLAMLVLDVILILAGFSLVGTLYLAFRPLQFAFLQAQLLLPLYLTLALYQRTYSIHALQDWRFAATRALGALALAGALLIFVTFYTKSTAQFSRVVFTGGFVASALLITASRWGMGRLIGRSWGTSVINLLHIDAGGPPVSIANAIRIDAAERGLNPDVDDPEALDRVGRFLLNMDRVVVSCAAEDREAWAGVLRASGVRGELVSDRLNELQPIGLAVEDGWRALIVSTGPLGMRQRVLKRGFDLALSVGGLVALSPLMLTVALLIKLEDGGPVFFVQRRLGRGNRFFGVYKFRSMKVERSDSDGRRSAARDDDRVTRIGRLIRRTSIDELPQLANVVRGEMSMVGPRPHAIGSQAGDKLFWRVDSTYWHRHALKPGVTGLAQIRGYRGATAHEADLQNRLDADLEYIRTWSPWGDALIVLKTVGVLVHRQAF
jgi:lipopolysaccharide/colanic/teichoic acid biosynthesis glycosyltransferase